MWHVHEAHDNKTALAQFSDTRDLTCIQHAFELRIFGLGLPRKQLYMMCTLAEGTFTHKGDGGYINWAYEGNVTRSDEHGKPYVHGPIANFLPIKLSMLISVASTFSLFYESSHFTFMISDRPVFTLLRNLLLYCIITYSSDLS